MLALTVLFWPQVVITIEEMSTKFSTVVNWRYQQSVLNNVKQNALKLTSNVVFAWNYMKILTVLFEDAAIS